MFWLLDEPEDLADGDKDGPENSINAAIAGFLDAQRPGRLIVLQPNSYERTLVDVQDLYRRFEDSDELVSKVRDILHPAPVHGVSKRNSALQAHFALLESSHRRLPTLFAHDGVELPDVHVELVLQDRLDTPSGLDEAHSDSGSKGEACTLRQLLTLTSADYSDITRRWVVLGDPGAGKSTACRFLVHKLAQEARENDSGTAPIPIFAPLTRLFGVRREECNPFDLAQRDLRVDKGSGAEGLAEELEGLAESSSQVWIFLDGLDELDEDRRERARTAIGRWSERFEQCVFVVTSRTAGFTPIPGFLSARIQPLIASQQKELLGGWLGGEAGEVWASLQARPSLWSLCSNPMLLSLLAYTQLVASSRGRLPETRHGLYRLAIQTLLKCGHRQGGGVESPDAAERVLPFMGLMLQERGYESWERNALLDVLHELPDKYPSQSRLRRLLDPWNSAVDVFLEDVADNSGLIADHDGEDRPWRWLHRSIGEFLAAQALNILGEGYYTALAGEVDDAARWGEVFGHLCGLMGSSDGSVLRLLGLLEANPEIVLRALPEVDGLDPSAALQILDSLRERDKDSWDGDDLLSLVRAWLRDGHRGEELRDLLLTKVSPKDSLDHVAFTVYALETAGIDVGPARVRELIAQRSGTGDAPSIDWVRIPPTEVSDLEFLMGGPESDPGSFDDERPVHAVSLRPFELASVPATEALLREFDPTRGDAVTGLPAVSVSWWTAWLFCRWVGGYLPTEAQWEYACRAGTTTPWSTGESLGPEQANIG